MARNITQHLENFKRDGLTIFENQLDVTVLDQWRSIFKKELEQNHNNTTTRVRKPRTSRPDKNGLENVNYPKLVI